MNDMKMVAEITELVTMLRWAMSHIPEKNQSLWGINCPHCFQPLAVHTDDCPWLRAKTLLEKYDG